MLTVVQCRRRKISGEGKITGCFKRKMVEVAPCPISREQDFGVVWEIELEDALVEIP